MSNEEINVTYYKFEYQKLQWDNNVTYKCESYIDKKVFLQESWGLNAQLINTHDS